MLVSGGENLFPREVEELLIEHPAVEDVAIIGVDVKGLVRKNLAGYKVPRDVIFLDELPRNPTGKVLKMRTGRPPRGLSSWTQCEGYSRSREREGLIHDLHRDVTAAAVPGLRW